MSDLRDIPMDDIEVGTRLRVLNETHVDDLKSSIMAIGLMNPVTVQRGPADRYVLVAGAHRLEAFRRAGYSEIPANILDLNDLERQLAECDENLCNARLTPVEEAIFLARRKEVYEALYPETKHGGSRVGNQVEKSSTPAVARFTADTSAKTGLSERTVQHHAERGKKIIDEVLNLVKGTKLDRGSYLDKIKGLTANDQVKAAKRDLGYLKRQAEEKAAGKSAPRQGGIAGRIAAKADTGQSDGAGAFDRFLVLADQIEALAVTDIIANSGKRKSILGQRASSLAERMSEIMEGLNQ